MCDYCEPDEAGNLKWMREDPDGWAYLEEDGGEWGIVVCVSVRCCGAIETYVVVRNCPMCGRDLGKERA